MAARRTYLRRDIVLLKSLSSRALSQRGRENMLKKTRESSAILSGRICLKSFLTNKFCGWFMRVLVQHHSTWAVLFQSQHLSFLNRQTLNRLLAISCGLSYHIITDSYGLSTQEIQSLIAANSACFSTFKNYKRCYYSTLNEIIAKILVALSIGDL